MSVVCSLHKERLPGSPGASSAAGEGAGAALRVPGSTKPRPRGFSLLPVPFLDTFAFPFDVSLTFR